MERRNPAQKRNETKNVSSETRIRVVKCEKGHFYDASKYGKCPYCGSNENMSRKSYIAPPVAPLHPPTMPEYPRVWFMCPKCGMRIEKHDYHSGEEVICGHCKTVIVKGSDN